MFDQQHAPEKEALIMRRTMVALFASAFIGAAPLPAERIVSGDALVAVVVNGTPLHLRIEPSAPGLPQIAPALAPSLGLKGGGFFGLGVAYRIGHEMVYGRTQVAKVGWDGGKPAKQRVGWASRAYAPPADGTVGPAGLPEPVIRFQLHQPRPVERVTSLPMLGGTGLFGDWFVLEAGVRVGESIVRLRFDPHKPRSLATAAAAEPIAAAHGGVMTAEAGRQIIAFGIERPYRVMRLGRPLGPPDIALTSVGVRVTDGDVAGRIAEEGAAPERVDPDEVVVTAKGKKQRPGILILGADALAGCSSIVFDRPARQVRLSCAK